MYKLRDYQTAAVNDALDFINNRKKKAGIIVQPTGAGKSLIIANIAKSLKTPVLVLQPSKELLVQNYNKYTSYGETATIYSASHGTKELSKVTFATPLSVAKIPQEVKKMGVEVLIVDECHYGSGVGQTLSKFIKNSGVKKVVGLTATPVLLANGMYGSELRMLNRTVKSFYQEIIHVTQIQDLCDRGFWSKLVYEYRDVDTSKLKFNTTGSDFLEKSVRDFYDANGMNRLISEVYDELLSEGRKHILCFTSLVDEAKALQKMIGDKSVVVYGDMKPSERDSAIEGFKSGRYNMAINVNVLGTGFDFPEVDACIHARPTASIGLYYQHLGRLVRTHPLKQDAKLVDLSSNYLRFGKLENIVFENREDTRGWCMRSGSKILTAYSKPDVTFDYKPKLKKVLHDPAEYKIPFGKHKDKVITEAPKSYLEWIASDDFKPNYQSAYDLKNTAKLYLSQQQS